jgi:hypothetical protein
MATAELKVRIEADLKQYQDALNKTVKETNAAEGQINKSVAGVAKSFSVLNNTKFTFGQNYVSASQTLANQAKKTSETLGGSVAKGANQAGFALQNLGRVAQDAPFGFIGIQNNLNPLLESFQQLKAQTGSTSLAFKALGASLLGPAGLGIAFSVVSSAILFYQQYQQKANRETKVAVDTYRELTDSIKGYAQVQAQGRENASKNLSQLQSLYKATQNVNIPQTERLKIANELIKQYPTYLKGFSAEEVIAGKATIAYQKLSQAILAKGLAQAAESNRQKLINKQLEDEVKLAQAQESLNQSIAKTKKPGQALPGLAASFEPLQLADAVSRDTKAVNDLKNGIAATAKEITLLDNVTQKLITSFGSEVVINPERIDKSNKSLKETSAVLKDIGIDFEQIKIDGNAFAGQLELLKISNSVAQSIEKEALAQDAFNKGLEEATLITEKFQSEIFGKSIAAPLENLSTSILPQLRTSFQSFFDDILMRGKLSFDSLGKAIANTFASVLANQATTGVLALLGDKESKAKGNIFSSVGKLLGIGGKGGGEGLATKGIGKLLGTVVPIAGIALGAASILGGIFKKKQPIQPQPSFTTSNAISTSSSSNVDFGNGRVVFEISGVNLVGVLNRAGAKLQRFGP